MLLEGILAGPAKAVSQGCGADSPLAGCLQLGEEQLQLQGDTVCLVLLILVGAVLPAVEHAAELGGHEQGLQREREGRGGTGEEEVSRERR